MYIRLGFPTRLGALGIACASVFAAPALADPRDDALWTRVTREQPAVVQTLQQLVEIETGTGNLQGLAAMANLLESRMKSVGLAVRREAAREGRVGENLIGTESGKGQKKLLLIAHMDTVYPAGTLARRPYRVEGGRAYGPGIADDKSGVAMILHVLALLREQKFDGYGRITVLFNVDEEQGSFGSRGLLQELGAASDVVLNFEPSRVDHEDIALGTSGINYVRVFFAGKASHAGMAPEQGANAVVEMADFILSTRTLDDPSHDLRFNWTVAKGGEVSNIIPDQAMINADMRYRRNDSTDTVLKVLQDRASKPAVPGVVDRVELTAGRPAYNATDAGRQLAARAAEIYREAGGQLAISESSGAGDDSAYAALSGTPTIDGLGLPGFGYHSSNEEYIALEPIPRRLYLAARLIQELSH